MKSFDGRKARKNEFFKHVFEKISEIGIYRNIDQMLECWKSSDKPFSNLPKPLLPHSVFSIVGLLDFYLKHSTLA